MHSPHSAQTHSGPSALVAPDIFGNTTFFTVWARWPGQLRLASIEWDMIETEDEAIAVLRENPRAVVVFRHDSDVSRRDVSEDIARQETLGPFYPVRIRIPETQRLAI
jgi:hypothetical protein